MTITQEMVYALYEENKSALMKAIQDNERQYKEYIEQKFKRELKTNITHNNK